MDKPLYESGATRSEIYKARFDLIPSHALTRLALRYGLGAVSYGDLNWLKGMPFSDTLNHIQQHLENAKMRYRRGVGANVGDEDAIRSTLCDSFSTEDDDLAAAAWGCFALITMIAEGTLVPDGSWYPSGKVPQQQQEERDDHERHSRAR